MLQITAGGASTAFKVLCTELCTIIHAKLREFMQIFSENGRLAGGGWPLLLGRTEEGKFKHSGIILYNAVYLRGRVVSQNLGP